MYSYLIGEFAFVTKSDSSDTFFNRLCSSPDNIIFWLSKNGKLSFFGPFLEQNLAKMEALLCIAQCKWHMVMKLYLIKLFDDIENFWTSLFDFTPKEKVLWIITSWKKRNIFISPFLDTLLLPFFRKYGK